MACKQGDFALARSLQQESLELYRELGDRRGAANALGYLALAAREQGDWPAARSFLEQCFIEGGELGEKAVLSNWLAWAANLEAAQGGAERAACLLGTVKSLQEAREVLRTPNDDTDYERDVALARTRLSEEAFTSAWDRGRALTLDEAVAYARKEGLDAAD